MPEGNVDIVTLLLSKDKIRTNNKREREELILSEKQFKDEAELTFKPQTNVRDEATEPQGPDRCHDLYNKVKKGQYALKHNKDNEEYEYDKNYKECTLHPQVNDNCREGSFKVWKHESKQEVKGTEDF